jgi:hypothetical protein
VEERGGEGSRSARPERTRDAAAANQMGKDGSGVGFSSRAGLNRVGSTGMWDHDGRAHTSVATPEDPFPSAVPWRLGWLRPRSLCAAQDSPRDWGFPYISFSKRKK